MAEQMTGCHSQGLAGCISGFKPTRILCSPCSHAASWCVETFAERDHWLGQDLVKQTEISSRSLFPMCHDLPLCKTHEAIIST